MQEQIRKLEELARPLEPNWAQRASLLGPVLQYANDYIDSITDLPAYVQTADGGRRLYDSPISETGVPIETALQLLKDHVDRPGVNPTSDRFLGYIPGGALFHSAPGDFLAAVSNRYSGVFFAGPGAVRMENMLWNWMADIVGYSEQRAGSLTSGGSIANLAGIVTARDAHGVEGEVVARSVVYLTEHVHHAVGKALRIAGCGRSIHRTIPVDEGYRMNVEALDDAIRQDRRAGLNPWQVVASAGTTNTGSVDPMEAIGQVSHARDLWFHVDGAYGAFFVLCPEGKGVLAGMDSSDSLVMDPHKTLFLPYGTGAILVKDRTKLYASHHEGADYMQDTIGAVEELSPADLSPELTRHFRGMRLWLPLKLVGVAPFRAALSEKILLTRYFHQHLQAIPDFEAGPYPELSVTIYRYVPKRGDADAFNARLVKELMDDGRIFISSVQVDGRFTLRLAVGVYRTHLDAIEETLDILTRTAKHLADNS